jgi:hypothetical protein
LDTNKRALKLVGYNSTDDLCALIVHHYNNFEANATYRIFFDISFATDILIEGIGAGGSPDLPLGAGAINVKPMNRIEDIDGFTDGIYRGNFSSFQNGEDNQDFCIVGRIGATDEFPGEYTIAHRNNFDKIFQATSNDQGELWGLIGIDSSFEGITTIYFLSIDIYFLKLE